MAIYTTTYEYRTGNMGNAQLNSWEGLERGELTLASSTGTYSK